MIDEHTDHLVEDLAAERRKAMTDGPRQTVEQQYDRQQPLSQATLQATIRDLSARLAAVEQERDEWKAQAEKWGQLTDDERDLLHDGLAELEATANYQATMWAGRTREKLYRGEASTAKSLMEKLFPDTSPDARHGAASEVAVDAFLEDKKS